MIKIHDVSHTYMLGKVKVQALKNINLDIKAGQMIALIGPSGSGKTSLLNLIGSLDTPTEGSIIVDGHQLNEMSAKEIQLYRKNTVSFIFQFFNLFTTLTLEENIEFPLLFSNIAKRDMKDRVKEALETVGLAGLER